MFKNILFNIKSDLSKHHRDKKDLEVYFIQERLNQSLRSYYADLTRSIKYLEYKEAKNVIKEL